MNQRIELEYECLVANAVDLDLLATCFSCMPYVS